MSFFLVISGCGGGGSGSTTVASEEVETPSNDEPEEPTPEEPTPEEPTPEEPVENLARFDSLITHDFETVYGEANWAQEEQLQQWK